MERLWSHSLALNYPLNPYEFSVHNRPMKTPRTHLFLVSLLLISCNGQDSTNPENGSNQTAIEGTITGGSTSGGGSDTQAQSFTDEFMELVNAHRASIGLRALINSDDISTIAQRHSDNMANGTIAFGHDGFSTRCSEARKAMGNSNACGENVAYGQKTPQAVFTSWMNSSGHKANIEKASYTHSGLGIKKNAKGVYYWTHLFLQVN